jgi:hypothetical protein
MISEPMTAPKGNGLTTALDIVISPADAFARLRVVPTWGYAFLIAAVLGMVGAFLGSAAGEHMAIASVSAAMAKDTAAAAMTPEKRQEVMDQRIGLAKTFAKFTFVFIPVGLLVSALLQSVYLLIINAIVRGEGNFKKYWALAINISIVGIGLGTLILGVIELIRGPEAFNSQSDLFNAIPSLAWIVPGAKGFVHGMLVSFSIFGLWATGLFALGLIAIARIKPAQAYVAAGIMLLFGAIIGGVFSSFQG